MNYYAFLILILMGFNSIYSEDKLYFSSVDNLRVRDTPSDEARIISKINKNTKIKVLDKSQHVQNINGFVAHWVKIKLAEENKTGFIFGAYLKNSKTNSEFDFTKCKVSSTSIRIFLNNSKVLTLKNIKDKDDTPEGSGVSFTDCTYFSEIDSVLILAVHYEGGENRLYNLTTGKYTLVWGEPIFSPDRKRFLCLSHDLEARYLPNGFQIFRIPNVIKKEFEFEFDSLPEDSNEISGGFIGFGPIEGKWIGNDSVEIIAENYKKTKTKKLFFKLRNNSWKQIENLIDK